MNNRKINLALTVSLVNERVQKNVVQFIKDLMMGFQEVGAFLHVTVTDNLRLSSNHTRETVKIQFENCTLDVALVSDHTTKSQYVQGFQLR